ncbi:MAG TPA: heavy-metal-associated domain-containing protein, partial [Planctomycetaceae bacterium]|nr:heavy-metal-associated domain-containing protein [Planctomycetaceae bacterium]
VLGAVRTPGVLPFKGDQILTLLEAVKETGYEVPTETVVLPIVGMTCASCVAHVEKALGTGRKHGPEDSAMSASAT